MDCFRILIALINIFSLSIKDEIDGKPNSSTSNDDNDSDDNEELRYDPSKNYEELAWEAFCDSNKEDPIIKKIEDIIKIHNEQ